MLVPAIGALAQVDGPTPPEPGDPDTGNTAPHAGYSAATDYCLQCHQVHNATGSYALMGQANVVAVCNTCHSIGGSGGTTAPGGFTAATGDSGTTSSRGVYVDAAVHTLSAGSIDGNNMTESGYDYTLFEAGTISGITPGTATGGQTATGGGLYCASCHTPHGDFGQMVNKWTSASEGSQTWFNDPADSTWKNWYIDYDSTGYFKFASTSGGVVAGDSSCTIAAGSCVYAQVDDAEGQLVSLYGYKLLTAHPNHQYATARTYNTTQFNADGAAWCRTCHTSQNTGNHHPGGCNQCHGNVSGESDWPHSSSNAKLLMQAPDALCISCHTNLP